MARRRSWTRRIVTATIIVLACFGGYTIYKQNEKDVDQNVEKVQKKVKAVKKALEK